MFALRFVGFVMCFVMFFLSIYGLQITAIASNAFEDYVVHSLALLMSCVGFWALKQ